jgi:hypothetical protein
VFRDAATDKIRSDDEVRDDAKYSGPAYQDGVCGVASHVGTSTSNASLFPIAGYKPKLAKTCGAERAFVFEFDDGSTSNTVVAGTLMYVDQVESVPDGATELRLGQFNTSACNRLMFDPDNRFTPGNGSNLLTVTYDAGSDSWTVGTQPYPNDKAWCDNDGQLWHMPFRATITRTQ